jgi:hypothetical protein
MEYVRMQGAVIVALLPPPSARNGRKQVESPDVVVADSSLRDSSLRICHASDPSMHRTYMNRRVAKSLCPRTCVTLQTLTLVRAETEQLDEGDLDEPVLHLLGEDGKTYCCELWGINFCKSESDSSSDEDDIFIAEPRVCSVMSNRCMAACELCGDDARRCEHMSFVQVHDGVQVNRFLLSILSDIMWVYMLCFHNG